jgi:peptidyl-prolyl cis-trans isomerase A (cyclophilin A)
MRIFQSCLLLTAALGLAACGGSNTLNVTLDADESSAGDDVATTTTEAAKETALMDIMDLSWPDEETELPTRPCPPPTESTPDVNLANPGDEAFKQTAPDTFRARFDTTKGVFVVEVTRAWAPLGADRFYNLVRTGFYDEVRFFRVIQTPKPFMAQFGINGDPDVAGAWQTTTLMDEPVIQSNTRGFLSYAKTGAPNSRSTQLFINFGDNSFLDPMGFSPFGHVVDGMDVVDSLYSGYGESASQSQTQIQSRGNTYLDANFPKLDHIVSARIE